MMTREEDAFPDKRFALELLRKVRLSPEIRVHAIIVAKIGLEMASKISKIKVDKKLVLIGGLLHDIGRSKTHGFEHALIGGQILRERGLHPKLARICETHILGGLDKEDAAELGLPVKDYLPKSIEEKIICLADKMTAGKSYVSVEKRFERWFSKYGKSEILLKSKKRVKEIQKEINELT